MKDEPVDVLIVGAGAAGAAIAWSLAETRMNIPRRTDVQAARGILGDDQCGPTLEFAAEDELLLIATRKFAHRIIG